jgi:hypothetical protein
MHDEARELGRQWRKAAERLPALDWRHKPPPRIHPDGAQYVAAPGIVALFSRERGYSGKAGLGFPLLMDACIRLVVCYENPIGRAPWPHDHAITTALCEGFFGEDLPKVLCQPPSTSADEARERWNFRLFTLPNWSRPQLLLPNRIPLGHVPWRNRTP